MQNAIHFNNPFIQTLTPHDPIASTSFEPALLLPDLFEDHTINTLSFNPNPFTNKTNNNDQLNPPSCSEHYLEHPSSHLGFLIGASSPQLQVVPPHIPLAPLEFENGLNNNNNNLDPLLLNPNNSTLTNSIDCWIDFTGGDSSCSPPSSSATTTTTSPTGSASTDPPASSTASNCTIPPSLIFDHHPALVQQQQQSHGISPEPAPQPLLPPPPAPPAVINSQVIPTGRTSYKRQCTRKTGQSLTLIEPSSSPPPPPSESSCSPSPSTSSSSEQPLSKSKPKNNKSTKTKKKNTNNSKKSSSSSAKPKPSTSATQDGSTSSSNDHHATAAQTKKKKMMMMKKQIKKGGEGRNEFLERNRQAASRSRAKKKTYQQFLEDQAGRLEAEQNRLHAIIHNLILEKDHLKSLVQAHSLASSNLQLQLP